MSCGYNINIMDGIANHRSIDKRGHCVHILANQGAQTRYVRQFPGLEILQGPTELTSMRGDDRSSLPEIALF
jgi:hypothetical protein